MTVSTNEPKAASALYWRTRALARDRDPVDSVRADFDPALTSGDGQGCKGRRARGGPGGSGRLPARAELIRRRAARSRRGRYRVFVCDDDSLERVSNRPAHAPRCGRQPRCQPARVSMRSTGSGRNGASATVEVLLARVSCPGCWVDGNLRLNGKHLGHGNGRSVHANGSRRHRWATRGAQEYFSASAPSREGAGASGRRRFARAAARTFGRRRIRSRCLLIIPATLRAARRYILGADGFVRNQARRGGSPRRVWSWDAGSRRCSGGGEHRGRDVLRGWANIDIHGNPGRGGPGPSPLPLTADRRGLDRRHRDSEPRALADRRAGIFFVAGTDLRLAWEPRHRVIPACCMPATRSTSPEPEREWAGAREQQRRPRYPPNPRDPAQNNLIRLQAGSMAISGTRDDHVQRWRRASYLPDARRLRECRGNDPVQPLRGCPDQDDSDRCQHGSDVVLPRSSVGSVFGRPTQTASSPSSRQRFQEGPQGSIHCVRGVENGGDILVQHNCRDLI
jgi:hypothetical protein